MPPDSYIKATIDAGARSRVLVFALLTASVAFFAGAWKSRPGSWEDTRLEMARDGYLYWEAVVNKESTTNREISLSITGSNSGGYSTNFYKPVEPPPRKRIDQIRRYLLETRKITTQEEAKHYYDDLMKERIETVMHVKVPIFGVQFDINDIGIMAGLTFAVILTMLTVSLDREVKNLRLVFEKIRNGNTDDQRAVFDILSMNQVLNVPPVIGECHTRDFWSGLMKSFLVLPIAIQGGICAIDLNTLLVGVVQNETATATLLLLEGLFLGMIVVLTMHCFSMVKRIDCVFDEAAARLKTLAT
ncbi:MAG: hypothetical protein HY301_15990 [Verrucomicrobia bacterium]|nr:hypothetical protein [Verrucomicrobiota bacterium]